MHHADIANSLAQLFAQRPQTPAEAGISGARHAAAASGESSSERLGATLDALVDRVKGLRQRTAEATLFLPAYDIRRAHEVGTHGHTR